MLATFSLKVRGGIPRQASFSLSLCSFSDFWPSWPPSREKCRARFSILDGCGLDVGRFWDEVSGDNFGLRLLLENLWLLLENLSFQFRLLLENQLFRSILLASGSGWAGGAMPSAKMNFMNSKPFLKIYIKTMISSPILSKMVKKQYCLWYVRWKHCKTQGKPWPLIGNVAKHKENQCF